MSISYRINQHKKDLIKQETYDSDYNPVSSEDLEESLSEYKDFRESRVLENSTSCEKCNQLSLPHKYYNNQPSSFVCQTCGYMFPNRSLKLIEEDKELEDPLSDINPNMNKRQYRHKIDVASDKRGRLKDTSETRESQVRDAKFAKNIDPIRDYIQQTGRILLPDNVTTRNDAKIIDLILNNPLEEQIYEYADTEGKPIPHHPNDIFLENQDHGKLEYSIITPPKDKVTSDENKLVNTVDKLLLKQKDIEEKTDKEVQQFLKSLKR